MYISANFSNWHFKRNILGKMIVLGNGCINLCPEKCIISQIPIPCQEMYSEQLECLPVSSSTMSLGSGNPNFSQDRHILGKIMFKKTNNLSLFVPMGLNESVFSISFRKSFQKLSSRSNTKTINVFVRKKGVGHTFTRSNEA